MPVVISFVGIRDVAIREIQVTAKATLPGGPSFLV
jgi:hypothetical protein